MGVVGHNACNLYWFHAAQRFPHGVKGLKNRWKLAGPRNHGTGPLSLSKNRSSFLLITTARTIPEKVFEKEAAN
jgi:hypothetical protein